MAMGMKMTTRRARKATTNGIDFSNKYSRRIRGDDIVSKSDSWDQFYGVNFMKPDETLFGQI
jgi:hypothetical protein